MKIKVNKSSIEEGQEAHRLLPKEPQTPQLVNIIVVPKWATWALVVAAPLIAPVSAVVGGAQAVAKYIKTTPERIAKRKRADALAALMEVAISTEEGAYMVEGAVRYGVRMKVIDEMTQQFENLQQEPEDEKPDDTIPNGLDPTDDEEKSTEAELEAFGLKDAPLVAERLPSGGVILRRQIPINVSLKEMKA